MSCPNLYGLGDVDFGDEGVCFFEVGGLIEDDGGIEILDDGGGVLLIDSDDGGICFSDVGGLIKGDSGIDILYDGDGISSCPSGELLSG